MNGLGCRWAFASAAARSAYRPERAVRAMMGTFDHLSNGQHAAPTIKGINDYGLRAAYVVLIEKRLTLAPRMRPASQTT